MFDFLLVALIQQDTSEDAKVFFQKSTSNCKKVANKVTRFASIV